MCDDVNVSPLTIIASQDQPGEDRASVGAQAGIMELVGVVEGCWGTTHRRDRQNYLITEVIYTNLRLTVHHTQL